MSQSPDCPKCGKTMKIRNRRSDGQKFWGCPNFPKCRGVRSYTQQKEQQQFQKRELKSLEHPNKYQQEIIAGVVSLCNNGEYNGKKHIIVSAGPGTGKTATEEHIVSVIKQQKPMSSIVYLVFNKHVMEEAKSKGLPALTTHSKFFSDWRNHRKGHKLSVDNSKVYKIVKTLIPEDDWNDDKWMVPVVCQIVSKVKNTCAPTNDEMLTKICDRFNVETNGSANIIFNLVRTALDENNKLLDVLDYDDMLYLPWKFRIPVQQYDWVLGDEVQDWNRVQIELIKRSVKDNGGHALMVGDRFQSMYGFRGADLNSMDNLKKMFDATELGLHISYRCAKSHVRLLNVLFTHIPLEQFDGAKEGSVEEISRNRMLQEVKDGDLVICRTNAPLVKPVFSLIRRGQKAIIRGRDIGEGLINLLEKHEAPTLDATLRQLVEYGDREVAKLLNLEKNSQAASLEDRIATVLAISDGCKDLWEVRKRIQEIFSDDKEGVVFSSVHRAKGDEAVNVFVLEPQQMPHQMAEQDWEVKQEMNIIWVALSRSKDRLVFVGGPVPVPFNIDNTEWTEEDDKIADEVVEKLEVKEIARNVDFTIEQKEEKIEVKITDSEVKVVPECPF